MQIWLVRSKPVVFQVKSALLSTQKEGVCTVLVEPAEIATTNFDISSESLEVAKNVRVVCSESQNKSLVISLCFVTGNVSIEGEIIQNLQDQLGTESAVLLDIKQTVQTSGTHAIEVPKDVSWSGNPVGGFTSSICVKRSPFKHAYRKVPTSQGFSFGASTKPESASQSETDINIFPISATAKIYLNSLNKGKISAEYKELQSWKNHECNSEASVNIKLFVKKADFSKAIVQLNKMFLENAHDYGADLEVIPRNGAGIKCHKLFIVAQSQVMAKELLEQATDKPTINLGEYDEISVKHLLAYLYYRDMEPLSKSSKVAVQLLKLACKYQINDLVTDVTKMMADKPVSWFEVDAAIQLFVLLKDNPNVAYLKQKVIGVLKFYSLPVLASPDYQKLFCIDETSQENCDESQTTTVTNLNLDEVRLKMQLVKELCNSLLGFSFGSGNELENIAVNTKATQTDDDLTETVSRSLSSKDEKTTAKMKFFHKIVNIDS